MIRISLAKSTVGSQSRSNLALVGLPIRWSTSVGRKNAGSILTCSCQSRPGGDDVVLGAILLQHQPHETANRS